MAAPRLRKLRSAATTVGSTLLVQLLVMVGGVLAARALGPEDRGHQAVFVTLLAITVQLVGLGVPTAANRLVAAEQARAWPLMRSVLPLLRRQSLIGTVIAGAAIFAFTVTSDSHVIIAGLIAAIGFPFALATALWLGMLLGLQRFADWGTVQITLTGSYAAVLAVLTITGSATLVAVVGLSTGAIVLAATVAGMRVRRAARRAAAAEVAPPTNAELVGFGRRALIPTVAILDNLRLDQVVVAALFSPRVAGLYSAGVAISQLPRLLAWAVGLVGFPHIASRKTVPERRRASRQLWLAGTALATGASLALMPIAGEIIRVLFGPAFAEAGPLTVGLLAAAAIAGSRRALTDGLLGAGETRQTTRAELLALATFALLAWPLAELLGAEGVAWAAGLASGLALAFLFLTTRKFWATAEIV